MLAFLGAVVRIVLGFVAACLAASFVQVLFAVTPAELLVAGEARWSAAVTWAILSTAHIAVFAAPFALISIVISEWQGIRSFAYHTIVAMAIAVAGFGLIMMTEAPTQASIVNSYAMAAYLTSGFIAGFVYWLLSGRSALRADDEELLIVEGDFRAAPVPAPEPPRPAATAVGKTTGTVPATRPAPTAARPAEPRTPLPPRGPEKPPATPPSPATAAHTTPRQPPPTKSPPGAEGPKSS